MCHAPLFRNMASGEVIFTREVDDGSDLWDDTALIKAYDEAVNTMKAQLGQTVPGNSESDGATKLSNSNKKKHKKNRRKHRKRDKLTEPSRSSAQTQFKVGDHCRAVFTEDGQLYEAVIISLDDENEICRVRYLGYGNEEDQLLSDILPSRVNGGDVMMSDGQSECDSLQSSSHGSTLRKPSQFKVPFGRNQGAQRPTANDWVPPAPPQPPLPPLYNMGQSFGCPPMMPPLFPPTLGTGLPSFPNGLHPMEIPTPPAIDDEDLLDNDNEALHSMLISWYMSGYHTGYYQGLKEGKKLAAGGKSKSPPTETGPEKEGTR